MYIGIRGSNAKYETGMKELRILVVGFSSRIFLFHAYVSGTNTAQSSLFSNLTTVKTNGMSSRCSYLTA